MSQKEGGSLVMMSVWSLTVVYLGHQRVPTFAIGVIHVRVGLLLRRVEVVSLVGDLDFVAWLVYDVVRKELSLGPS